MIRKLEKNEFRQAADLSLKVFTYCGTEDFNAEGLETFNSFIYADELMNELTVYGAFDGEKLIGVLGIKNERKHISLFFINPEYHRKGIGSKLFDFVLQNQPMQELTVNSSSYAVSFYQSIGFEKVSEKQETNGLKYTPMKRIS